VIDADQLKKMGLVERLRRFYDLDKAICHPIVRHIATA